MEIPADFHAAALQSIVTTIMLFGELPQPKSAGYPGYSSQRKQFDLHEWALEKIPGSEMADLYVAALIGDDDLIGKKAKELARIEKLLTEHLRDSEIVEERAQEMMEDERDDHHADLEKSDPDGDYYEERKL